MKLQQFHSAQRAEHRAGWEGNQGFSLWSLLQSHRIRSQPDNLECSGASCTQLLSSGATEPGRQRCRAARTPQTVFFHLHIILVLKSLLISIHFQYVAHTGSLDYIIQCIELRNLLLGYSSSLLISSNSLQMLHKRTNKNLNPTNSYCGC